MQITTVLCVDDEPNVLASLKRMLRNPQMAVISAQSGAEALEILERLPIDLVISDMRMPVMDGAALLEQIYLRWPHVVRVLLTGQADVESTVAAVNRGRVFRYLHKPWDDEDLRMTVRQGLDMRRLEDERSRLEALTAAQNRSLQQLNAELEDRVRARTAELSAANLRLQRGHLKTIKAFVDLIELRSGALSGHGKRVAELARSLARHRGLPENEVLDIFKAGLLHDIALVGADDDTLHLGDSHHALHASRGAQSLRGLDDMDAVADLVEAHHDRFDGRPVPLGARILAVANALDELERSDGPHGHSRADAIAQLRLEAGTRFDPQVVSDLEALLAAAP